jgi:hypothetical protein
MPCKERTKPRRGHPTAVASPDFATKDKGTGPGCPPWRCPLGQPFRKPANGPEVAPLWHELDSTLQTKSRDDAEAGELAQAPERPARRATSAHAAHRRRIAPIVARVLPEDREAASTTGHNGVDIKTAAPGLTGRAFSLSARGCFIAAPIAAR